MVIIINVFVLFFGVVHKFEDYIGLWATTRTDDPCVLSEFGPYVLEPDNADLFIILTRCCMKTFDQTFSKKMHLYKYYLVNNIWDKKII